MKSLPDYTEFKHKLLTNPRWLARALVVLAFTIKPRGISLEAAIELAKLGDVVRRNDELRASFGEQSTLPWAMDSKTGKWAINFVRKQAPSVYNYAKEQALLTPGMLPRTSDDR